MNPAAVFIPTLNNHSILKRTLEFYVDMPIKADIHIVDSSRLEDARVVNILKELGGKNHYWHEPGMNISQVIFKYLPLLYLNYEFIAYSGDDDVFLSKGFNACLDFISENKDCFSIQGLAAIGSLSVKGYPFSPLRLDLYWGKKERKEYKSTDRVRAHYKNYFNSQFSISRNFINFELLKGFEIVINSRNHFFGEHLHSFAQIASGKNYFLCEPYLIRGIMSTKRSKFVYDETMFKFASELDRNFNNFITLDPNDPEPLSIFPRTIPKYEMIQRPSYAKIKGYLEKKRCESNRNLFSILILNLADLCKMIVRCVKKPVLLKFIFLVTIENLKFHLRGEKLIK